MESSGKWVIRKGSVKRKGRYLGDWEGGFPDSPRWVAALGLTVEGT